MRWFGESWKAPICETVEHIETPVGMMCSVCGKAIGAADQGLLIPRLTDANVFDLLLAAEIPYAAFHLHCFAQSIGVTILPCNG
jgi:hypothetical protein